MSWKYLSNMCNEEYSLGTRSGTRCGSLSGHDLLFNYADKLTYFIKCVIMYDKNHSKLGYYNFFYLYHSLKEIVCTYSMGI